MSLVIKDTGTVPGEGWIFTVAQTGFQVRSPNWSAFYGMILQHCEANSVQPPSLQEVIDASCRDLHIPCFDSETRQPLINKLVMGTPLPPTSCCGKG